MPTPEEIKEKLRILAYNYDGASELTKGQKGGTIGALEVAFGTPLLRRRFLGWIFANNPNYELSTKLLSPAQWWALWKWIDFFDEDGKWYKGHEFLTESAIIAQYLANEQPIS